MIPRLIPLLLLPTVVPFAPGQTVHELNARLSPGMNLGNTLEAPADGSWANVPKPDPAYIDLIADAGFASVRLPIRWSDWALREPPYTIDPAFFRTVDAMVDRALQRGLRVIINVHHYKEFYEDPAGHLPRFLRLWEQIAAHYAHHDRTQLFFEVLNEPEGPMGPKEWQGVFNAGLLVIRKSNPDRPVLFGGSPWNGWQTVFEVQVPKDDNLILTFHYYLPFAFTHQRAPWLKGGPQAVETFSASPKEVAEIASHFAQVKAWADAHNLPVSMGEFGAFSAADMASRVRYTRTVRELAEAFGFSWNYWEFASGFGIYDRESRSYHEDLKAALVGED